MCIFEVIAYFPLSSVDRLQNLSRVPSAIMISVDEIENLTTRLPASKNFLRHSICEGGKKSLYRLNMKIYQSSSNTVVL